MGGHELIKLMQVNAISGKRSSQLMRMLLTLDTYGTHIITEMIFLYTICVTVKMILSCPPSPTD